MKNKLVELQLKALCTAKDTVNKIKKRNVKNEKKFTSYIPDKGLI